MGFSFSMEGRNIALESPEQIDTLIQFLHLYKTLTTNSEDTPILARPTGRVFPTTPARTDSPTTEASPVSTHPLIPAPGQRISDFATTALKSTEAGLNTRDLAKAMLSIGWISRSDKEAEQQQAVNTALLRYKNEFTKLPDGTWIVNAVHSKLLPTRLTLETVATETVTE